MRGFLNYDFYHYFRMTNLSIPNFFVERGLERRVVWGKKNTMHMVNWPWLNIFFPNKMYLHPFFFSFFQYICLPSLNMISYMGYTVHIRPICSICHVLFFLGNGIYAFDISKDSMRLVRSYTRICSDACCQMSNLRMRVCH